MNCIIRLCVMLMALTATPAAAWGPIGHRVSAEIAERNISGRTAAQVARILGTQSLREAATVPDEQRNNPDPFWQAAAPWHYITLPRGQALAEIAHPPQGDAMTAIDGFVATLRDPSASLLDQQRALQFVVHLAADLHLPVHVGDERFGGGGMPVLWFGQRETFHWVWDEGLIGATQLTAPEYAAMLAARTTPEQVTQWWDHRPATWLNESAALRDQVYAELDERLPTPDRTPMAMGWEYQYRWRPAMELRLQQSGIRTAAMLEWIFSGQP